MTQATDRQLDDTIAILQGDLESADLEGAGELLERWRRTLARADFEEAEDLSGLLAQLQGLFEGADPNPDTLAELLADLAALTQQAADRADEDFAGKLQLLADSLGDSADSLG